MFKFIERLQQASLAKRKSVVFFASAIVTLVIFGFWAVTFTRTNTPVIAEILGDSKGESASPLDAIRHAAKNFFGGTSQTYERQ